MVTPKKDGGGELAIVVTMNVRNRFRFSFADVIDWHSCEKYYLPLTNPCLPARGIDFADSRQGLLYLLRL